MSGPYALLPILALAGSALTDYCYRGSAGGVESFTVTGQTTWAPDRSKPRCVRSAGTRDPWGSSCTTRTAPTSTSSSTAPARWRSGSTARPRTYTLLGSTPLVIPLGRNTGCGGSRRKRASQPLLGRRPQALGFRYDLRPGRIGLRVWNMTADFDDVLALDPDGSGLFADDFDDGTPTAGRRQRMDRRRPGGSPCPNRPSTRASRAETSR